VFLEDEDEEDKVQKQVEEKYCRVRRKWADQKLPFRWSFLIQKQPLVKKARKNPRNPGSMKEKNLAADAMLQNWAKKTSEGEDGPLAWESEQPEGRSTKVSPCPFEMLFLNSNIGAQSIKRQKKTALLDAHFLRSLQYGKITSKMFRQCNNQHKQ